jgi:hypothetical protein
VEVAVGVARVEGLDGGGDEEVTLAVMADAFAAGGAADAVDLVEGVGHVIGEGGGVESPGLVGLGWVLLRGCRKGESENCEEESFHAGLIGALTKGIPQGLKPQDYWGGFESQG